MHEYYEKWIKLVQKCDQDPVFRNNVEELVKRDVNYFFNNFLWTYDPRKKVKTIPFQLWPFQEDFLAALNDAYTNKDPLLVEKSRDMGYSWLFLGWSVWKMVTEEEFSAGIGSQKMDKVDSLGNPDSLFEKIRILLRRLPPFLQCGWDESKDSRLGLITIPQMKTSISGEGGDNIGRGGRKSCYFLDEWAHVARSSMVHESVSENSDVIIFGSTPKGKGNEFARLRWKTNIKVFIMDWHDHPNKDQAWYDKKAETMTKEQMAQEIDRSYAKSQEGKVYKWFDADKHANTVIEYNKNYDVMATFDWGIGDPCACLFLQYYSGIIHVIGAFEYKDLEITRIFTKVQNYLSRWIRYDGSSMKIEYVSAWFGDPDARNRNPVHGDSIKSFIKDKYNITLRFKLPNLIRPRILSVRMMGEHGRIKISSDLHHVIECLENYVYPERENSENEKPKHNWACHTPSALEYYTVVEHGMDQFENKDCQIYSTSFR